MRTTTRLLGVLVLLLGLTAGCGRPERLVTAALPLDDARVVATGVSAFGFDLLAEVGDGRRNTVISPVSAAALLSLVLAGARGRTATELADVLHVEGARDPRLGALLDELRTSGDVTLSVGNALWGDDGTGFEEDYVSYLQRSYGATLAEADLGRPSTADAIDDWAHEQTHGKVPTIAADLDLPDPDAVAVLLNAVHFAGEWQTAFDADQTRREPFTLADGSRVSLPIMHQRDQEYAYADREGYALARLPYGRTGRFGMTIWLPDADSDLPTVLGRLDAAERRAGRAAMEPTTLSEVGLPRFELRWGAKLNEPLAAVGMPTVFSGAADLGAMSPRGGHLSVVHQKTYLRVDERGTEAAAVTGGAVTESAPRDPAFVVDRPFLFSIDDRRTGATLFLGTVADPRG